MGREAMDQKSHRRLARIQDHLEPSETDLCKYFSQDHGFPTRLLDSPLKWMLRHLLKKFSMWP